MTALRIEQACFRFALIFAMALPLWFRYAELRDRRHLEEAAALAGAVEGSTGERFTYQLQRVAMFDRASSRDTVASYASPALALLAFYLLRWGLLGRVRPLWPLRQRRAASPPEG